MNDHAGKIDHVLRFVAVLVKLETGDCERVRRTKTAQATTAFAGMLNGSAMMKRAKFLVLLKYVLG